MCLPSHPWRLWTALRAKFSTSFTDNAKLFGNFLVHSSGCPNWAFSTTNTVRWHSRGCYECAPSRSNRSPDNNDVDAATSFGAILKCLDRVQFALVSYSVCAWACMRMHVRECVSARAYVWAISRAFVSPVLVFILANALAPHQGFRQTKATATATATERQQRHLQKDKRNSQKDFSCARFAAVAAILINCWQLNSIEALIKRLMAPRQQKLRAV